MNISGIIGAGKPPLGMRQAYESLMAKLKRLERVRFEAELKRRTGPDGRVYADAIL